MHLLLFYHSCSMKVSFAQQDASPGKNLRITTFSNDQGEDEGSHSLSPAETKCSDHTAMSSPTYWHSPQGKKVMKTLPPAAPPLDLRKLEWENQQDRDRQDRQDQLGGELDESPYYEGGGGGGDGNDQRQRMVSTAYPAVGSALQAARRSNSNRAVTAPE